MGQSIMPIEKRLVSWDAEDSKPKIEPKLVKWDSEAVNPEDIIQPSAGIGERLGNLYEGAKLAVSAPFIGGGNLVGMVHDERVKQFKQDVSANMDKPGGFGGQAIGGGLVAAPAMAIPGMQGPAAQMAIGGLYGLTYPAENWKERAINTGSGVAGSGAGYLAGNLLNKANSPFLNSAQRKAMDEASRNSMRDTALAEGQAAGYVIPRSDYDPSFIGNRLESIGGKAAIKQDSVRRNQEVTNKLAAKSLGLPEETPITVEVLDGIRKTAGEAYDALASLPVKKGSKADTLTNAPEIAKIDPAKLVYDLRVARADSNAYYKNYARTADPEALTKARGLKAEATRIENALENYAKALGYNELLPELRNARQLIAKTYTVESALNQTTGSVNAQKLASDLNKGKPLSAELKQAAEFAQRFPKAARTPEQMGSLPQFSPLDVTAGAGLSAILQDPMALASIGVRPVARSLALSPVVQNRLARNPNDISQLLEILRTSTPTAITGLYSE